MPTSLTPEERSQRSRLGAHILHSRYDGREITANARAAGPGRIEYWLKQVDPGLPEAERIRRAGHLKKAFYAELALKSSIARRRKREAAERHA